ncbi:MAG TPA: glycoside hydrolase family 3 N-terminal domain-containing protein, partial [Candidatus Ozemobacteraceae bacterium]|nr:glycoside hydrolase family 3 N-terminal domain-containing protein [Candidatus Ozemobacteraceae bacterium]
MNLKKRIGQLMVVGFQGLEPSDDFLKFVEEWGIGGFIFFARNIDRAERIPQVVRRLEDAAGGPIFTSIDQEGGLVMRILTSGSPFPGAMALSATDDVDLTRKIHTAIGREMRALNLNWNLAPVLDINHRDNPGIGARSFGEDPERVSRFGCAAVEGLQAGGVLACAKHFPGKGHARVDSHLTLPTIPYDTARLESFELQPFRAAIRSGVASIMTSHVFFPAYESTPNLPATLSKAVLTDLLRGKLGFTGLLVTDDLEMGAITEAYGVAEAGFRSFMAGADLLLICHDLDRERSCAEKILDECRHNPDVEKRIN